jgi:diguanylate cyclase (GGDEF)-like protein
MPGVFSKLAQRVSHPRVAALSSPQSGIQNLQAAEEQTAAALALSRELLHSVEQFVISTPDLDTARFLQRLRGTAAGLIPGIDIPTTRLYQEWVRKALGTFASLQRRNVVEREDEMWRLLDAYARCAALGQQASTSLTTALLESHERMREAARLPDLQTARERLEEELKQSERLAEQKAREDKERLTALGREVSRLQAELAAVRGQARYDALTKIYHRGAFLECLSQLLAEGKPCGLAFMDVDNFKTINDTLGHPIGDRVLMVLAEQLRRGMRTTDAAARFGGDEFCFLAPGLNMEQLAQRLVGAVARRHVRLELEERVCSVLLSVSVGIAQSRLGDTAEELLERANQALMQAKQTGKGGIQCAPPPE